MKPSEALAAHRNELRQLVSRYGLSRPRVFGSVLSGTDTDESDLDLLVDAVPGSMAALEHFSPLRLPATSDRLGSILVRRKLAVRARRPKDGVQRFADRRPERRRR